MILLLGLLWSFWTEPALCLQEDGGFSFDGDIRHFEVSIVSVFISTEKKLYQLSHDLTPVWTLSQRGVIKGGDQPVFHQDSEGNTTFTVNTLLPFVKNGSLISCGVVEHECGFCEIRDLKNISKILHGEHIQVGPLSHSSGSVGFMVDVRKDETKTETYILTAIEQDKDEIKKCSTDNNMMNLHDTDDTGVGGIFARSDSSGTAGINSDHDVDFVDGFQINSTVYLLSNVVSETKRIRLLWFQGKDSKSETLKSLRGATLQVSGDPGSKLLASSVIPGGQQVLWSGVFSVDQEGTETQLVLFDISPDLSISPKTDPDFYYGSESSVQSEPKVLKPKAVILKKNHMNSVLALRQRGWMVFLIGTSDGQLIKVNVDRNYRPTCPKVLYTASGDQNLFPKTHLDPVDQKHVYVPFKNQIKRVLISNCHLSRTLQECWSTQDPLCVWCVSMNSCVVQDDCRGQDWLSIPDEAQQKMVSHRVLKDLSGQMKLIVQTHLSLSLKTALNFACNIISSSRQLCKTTEPVYPQCTCILSGPLPAEDVTVKIRIGQINLTERLKLVNCSSIQGQTSSHLCQRCIRAGCGWRGNSCSWASQEVQNETFCQNMEPETTSARPEISSIAPSIVSFYGRNHALLSGRNLQDVIGVRIQADMNCNPQESPVWNNTGQSLTFHIPRTETKGVVKVCALLADGSCHSSATITYQSSPVCTDIKPSSTWISGRRALTIIGTHLDFVEGVIHDHALQQVILPRHPTFQNLIYETPAAENTLISSQSVYLKVANKTLNCSTKITYHPDPEFTSFTATWVGDDIQIVVQKKLDQLNITEKELLVWAVQDVNQHPCIMKGKESSNKTESFTCDISRIHNSNIKELKIQYGDQVKNLKNSDSPWIFMMLLLLLIPVIVIVVVFVYRSKQKQFTEKMNKRMEDIEIGIRNDIRQGFVDLQTEKADLMENVGAIPFLDYKHFASRIFFPESEPLIALCVKDIGQDVQTVQLDECCQRLSQLIQDQLFLTTMVHALEEQKSFNVKDKCSLASLLTVALHSDLSYLTEVMEVLLKDLMQQNSNAQPKLLLRRTESTVEKLLTNWMSICLYGFLRESVGQHLFLLVSALTQQVSKGPVDCVTEKALYTLSEDWLLWQAQDFSLLKLKVLFAVGSDGGVSEPLQVDALSCDTVEQLKEKILSSFKTKFGFPYGSGLREVWVEYEKDGRFLPLQDVDSSSEVIGEVMKLNTLRHYQVTDGATIKLFSKKVHPPLSPQGSLKDDVNFSRKYFHLIDPDEDEAQSKNPEKKKLKLKEVHLTKLLSTKVAVHTYVENLFRSIWSQSRAPHAVKYFFDFLDSQADNMKITEPDVRHIWKTNSLPLRFWINILKNPQFVFDLEKTPHVDACLSVIAQAFMDSFSLSDLQLGKHAPTNKLLYAKDVPKFKQEVKDYYRQIREQTTVTHAEFKDFLLGESKKHENEFNEAAALKELYKFIQRYYTEIRDKLAQNGAPAELTEQLVHVKQLFDGLKSCSWT